MRETAELRWRRRRRRGSGEADSAKATRLGGTRAAGGAEAARAGRAAGDEGDEIEGAGTREGEGMAGSTDGEGTVWRGAVRISGCLGALAKADADKRVAAELARTELAAA